MTDGSTFDAEVDAFVKAMDRLFRERHRDAAERMKRSGHTDDEVLDFIDTLQHVDRLLLISRLEAVLPARPARLEHAATAPMAQPWPALKSRTIQ